MTDERADAARRLAGLDQLIDTLADDADVGLLQAEQRPLVEALLAGAAPREALLNLRKLAAATSADPLLWPAAEAPAHLGALAAVVASGPELTRLLLRRPGRLSLLADPALGRPWAREELRDALEAELDGGDALDPSALAEGIAAFRNDQYVRLAACEFEHLASLEAVGQQLADVADVCLELAIERTMARLDARHGEPTAADGRRCGLVAMAMGKHGARELNFCSDIDVVFVYADDEGQVGQGERTLHEHFTAACREITAALTTPTPEGVAFRVDLRLRPEGDSGPLCNSLAATERYYETWGGPYDRLAWLKARPAAGELRLGEELLAILRPFIFPRHGLADDIVDQLLRLTQRIRQELADKPALTPGWHVKLGAGGIRDVEFFVQALQLVHGGQLPALRERGTIRALDKLLFAGLVSEQEHRALGEAYERYRWIEHRLQLHGGRQTHLLPDAGALRAHVVTHLGYDEATFAAELAERRAQVRAIHATLGAEQDGPPADPRLLAVLDGVITGGEAEATEARLAELGFGQPERARALLAQLADKPWGPFGHAPTETARRVARRLLSEVCRAPDPDATLGHLTTLSLRFGPFDGLWRMLDEDHEALRLLCSLFGTSDYLARMFIDHPELIDQLLGAGHARPSYDEAELRARLRRRLAAEVSEDLGDHLATLRRFRNEETLRIGLADIAGDLELEEVWRQLTALANVVLGELYPLVFEEIAQRYGRPREADGSEATMAVLGLGKLGAEEMSYGSDLDLIFVFSAEGHTDNSGRREGVSNGELFARLAQRLVTAVTANMADGRLYEVDARLRPSGAQGMLVVSRAAFCEHHREQDAIWKRQVLLKARPVAGDNTLGAGLCQWLETYLYEQASSEGTVAAAVAEMRARIERELAQEGSDFYNFKLGRGGLLDVEFTAQLLQLRHGKATVALRQRSTLAVLGAALEAGLIGQATGSALTAGYRFLRRLEGRLRIVRDRSAERLPTSAEALEQVARRLGYRDQRDQRAGEQLLAGYREHTDAIRRAYEETVGDHRDH